MAATASADQRFVENHAWFDGHFAELSRQYHGQYVAVDHGQILAASQDVAELAREVGSREGVLVARVVRPEEERHFLL